MHLITALEAGVVSAPGDLRIHAIRKTLHGRRAICGAGPILGLVPGRFDDVAEDQCPSCLALAVPAQSRSEDSRSTASA
ncbi:MAG TPA: hypothetical protein VFJ17_13000 [Mycobacteriales bacterium]|jgi:hypothetical protein|nr:hypothetical protein [Mycobacteriales bacterium]